MLSGGKVNLAQESIGGIENIKQMSNNRMIVNRVGYLSAVVRVLEAARNARSEVVQPPLPLVTRHTACVVLSVLQPF